MALPSLRIRMRLDVLNILAPVPAIYMIQENKFILNIYFIGMIDVLDTIIDLNDLSNNSYE